MSQIHLWQEEAIVADGFITLSAIIEAPQQLRKSLWYRVPIEYTSYLTSSCDPFVIAILFMAMSQSADLMVHGMVSPWLIRNLEEFQAVWSCWRPIHYHPVTIHAETEQEQTQMPSEERAITAFSGGVDSCYTVLRHRQGLCNRLQRNLQTGMLVHGFDIPLEQTQDFDQAVEGVKVMLSSVGMDLIPVATNFRQVVRLDWEDVFGTAIASCLMLFQNHYTTGLIPASYSYYALGFPYGSNPISDRLLSTQSFEIVHDGANAGRAEKIRHISTWQEGLQYLRVCWEGPDKYRNCGRCEKCIRNILNFRIIGMDSPPCFNHRVTNKEIRSLRVKKAQLDALEQLLKMAKQSHITDSWVSALEYVIFRNQCIELLKSIVPDSLKPQLKKFHFLAKY